MIFLFNVTFFSRSTLYISLTSFSLSSIFSVIIAFSSFDTSDGAVIVPLNVSIFPD